LQLCCQKNVHSNLSAVPLRQVTLDHVS